MTLATASLTACGATGQSEEAPPSPATPVRVPDALGSALPYYAQRFAGGALEFVRRVDSESWVVDGPSGARWVMSDTTVDLGADAGAIHAAARVDGALVVAGVRGLFVLQEGNLQPSPLSGDPRLGDVRRLLAVGSTLWLSTTTGLFVLEDDELWEVEVAGVGPAPMIAAGTSADALMWVAADEALFSVRRAGDDWSATQEPTPVSVQALVADAAGRVWIRGADGRLASRTPAGQWRIHEAVTGVGQVVGDPGDTSVWVATSSEVFRFDGEAFRAAAAAAGALEAAADGFMIADAEGLRRFVPDRRVDVIGLPDGVLAEAVDVFLRPAAADRVTNVSVTVDGASVATSAPTWMFTVDPSLLTDGDHELVVRVSYADADPTVVQRSFTVVSGPPPTWADDIQPLFVQNCALCHNEQGSARILDTAQSWIDNIDTVLFNVRTGRMPLPPNPLLTPADVARIEAWQAAGYPLSRE